MSGRSNKDLFLFWGKGGKAPEGGPSFHPALCHMIDVGIMAHELAEAQSPGVRRRILSLFGPSGTNGLAFTAAMHDIGKISPGFQKKREDLCAPLIELGFNFPESLVVVESPMGTGKTEASLAAFSAVAARDSLRGIYYALPTQATGNAMLPRMKSFLEKLDLLGKAELHLLHANADLNPDYEALQVRNIEEPEGNVAASSWFTARKRGLLAGYGTGTIDQALMAVLKVRHFFLRLFGLSGKLLILDEVHAYDAYMTEEISRLVGWLSRCDSSVILLSATLPQAKREQLLDVAAGS